MFFAFTSSFDITSVYKYKFQMFNFCFRNGFALTYKVADDPSIVIKKYDKFIYEHIIVFAPTVEEFGGTLSAEAMMEFVDRGGNMLVTAGSVTGKGK